MKFFKAPKGPLFGSSPPVWGAWVEIVMSIISTPCLWSPPVWGAWVEMGAGREDSAMSKSPPVWGAWIEIWSVLCSSKYRGLFRKQAS